MTDWQQRVIDEKDELGAKLLKLRAFAGSPAWMVMEKVDRTLLRYQLRAMDEYFAILCRRIERFTDTTIRKTYTDTRVP